MFTHNPRTGTSLGKPSRSALTRSVAALGATTLGIGVMLANPAAAAAQEVTSSYASAQFLSGTALGADLAGLVALAPAEARNDGTQHKQTSKDPLNASVLQAVNLKVPGGVQGDLGPVTDLGAVNQYAEAERDGRSFGSSGAIGDDGAIGVGTVGSGAAGDLTLDLKEQLDAQFAATIADLSLTLEAVAASARGDHGAAVGDYTLDAAVLTVSAPALANLTEKVDAALASVDRALLDLQSDNGILELALLDVLNPVLDLIGSSADVTVDLDVDVRAALAELLRGQLSDHGVTIDLQRGVVHLDLAALHGDLNNLPVNTELLSDAVITSVLDNITTKIASLADQIVAKVEATLGQARIDVGVHLDVLTGPADCRVPLVDDLLDGTGVGGTLDSITGTVGGVVDGVTDTVDGLLGGVVDGVTGGGGLVGGLLGGGGGGLLGGSGILGGSVLRPHVTTGLGGTLCSIAGPVLSELATTVDVDVEGTIGQILAGTADVASASVSILGGTVAASIDIDDILGELRAAVFDGLFDDDGAVENLIAALNHALVHPAAEALLGANGVGVAITDLLSVRVNLQELRQASPMGMASATGSMFTQTAVRVSVLGGSAATVNVAAATVGPNITQVIDPGCTVDCGPGGSDPDPECTVGCGPTPTAGDRLAVTGMGIAALIAVILALLAAGAMLAREGYRRTHPRSAG